MEIDGKLYRPTVADTYPLVIMAMDLVGAIAREPQRAAQEFPSVEYIEVEGGTHGNLGEDANVKSIEFILAHID